MFDSVRARTETFNMEDGMDTRRLKAPSRLVEPRASITAAASHWSDLSRPPNLDQWAMGLYRLFIGTT